MRTTFLVGSVFFVAVRIAVVEVTKELMLTQSREFLPIRKKESPHSVHNPEVSQLAMIVLSVWALPLAKLSAAAASRDQRGVWGWLAGWWVEWLGGWSVGFEKSKGAEGAAPPPQCKPKMDGSMVLWVCRNEVRVGVWVGWLVG